jgi:exodeoxyribonuclease-3
MRILTLNVNGIRSAARKGLFDWLETVRPWDVVCLQEIKAADEDLHDGFTRAGRTPGWFFPAQKKGYSGVALYARHRPVAVRTGIGNREFDAEGRYLEADFGSIAVASVYLPSGSSSEERQQAKFRFMKAFLPVLKRLRASGREIVLCGDWNIAHKEIDLKNWRGNRKNSGFLPEERAWMDELFGTAGFVDTFRAVNAQAEQYTWWSNRGQAWAKNVGWRIDYQVATPGIAATVTAARIYKDKRFSDHAPLIMDYDYAL